MTVPWFGSLALVLVPAIAAVAAGVTATTRHNRRDRSAVNL